ncbi:MAG: thiamine phosphate synthase [Gemmatimonadota bacterium]
MIGGRGIPPAAREGRRGLLYVLLDLAGPPDGLPRLLTALRGAWHAIDLLQVRAKDLPAEDHVAALREVRSAVAADLPSGRGPLLLANDRLDVSLAAGADGVHVGAEDLPPQALRTLAGLPEAFIVGLTCHDRAEVHSAVGRGADYLALGPFFPSSTKPEAVGDPWSALESLPLDFPLPVYAIGGITADNAARLPAHPALRGIVVSAAVQHAADPRAAVAELRGILSARPRA